MREVPPDDQVHLAMFQYSVFEPPGCGISKTTAKAEPGIVLISWFGVVFVSIIQNSITSKFEKADETVIVPVAPDEFANN